MLLASIHRGGLQPGPGVGSSTNTQMCAKATNNRCRGMQSPVQKSSMEVFFFLVSSFFSPKSGDSQPGAPDASAFLHFHTAPLPRPAVRRPYLLYPGSHSCRRGRDLVPTLPILLFYFIYIFLRTWAPPSFERVQGWLISDPFLQLRGGHGVCLMRLQGC